MKPTKKVLAIAKSYGFDGAEYNGEWNGYKVFDPIFDDPDKFVIIGQPIIILHNGKTTRIASEWEWPEILDGYK